MRDEHLTFEECEELAEALLEEAAALPNGAKKEGLLKLARGYHNQAIVGEKNLDIVLPGRQHLDIDGCSLTVGKRVRDRIEEEVG